MPRRRERPGRCGSPSGDSSQVGVGSSSLATDVGRARSGQAAGLHRPAVAGDQPGPSRGEAGHAGGRPDLPARQPGATPALVTVGAGANDVLWSFGLAPALDAIDLLLAALPHGAVGGHGAGGVDRKGCPGQRTPARPGARVRRRRIRSRVSPPGRRYLSSDLLHPNDEGYRFIADRFWDAVQPLVEPDRTSSSVSGRPRTR